MAELLLAGNQGFEASTSAIEAPGASSSSWDLGLAEPEIDSIGSEIRNSALQSLESSAPGNFGASVEISAVEAAQARVRALQSAQKRE